jgi:hypothetical protein
VGLPKKNGYTYTFNFIIQSDILSICGDVLTEPKIQWGILKNQRPKGARRHSVLQNTLHCFFLQCSVGIQWIPAGYHRKNILKKKNHVNFLFWVRSLEWAVLEVSTTWLRLGQAFTSRTPCSLGNTLHVSH